MITIKPLRGLRPPGHLAAQVASPPYDVISSEEARDMARSNPLSFLHVNKPEIDLPENTDHYSESVYEKGRENLEKFIQQGILQQDERAGIYIYRLTWHGHVQTGYFALFSVDDYLSDRIKKHELTRADKEADRTRLTDVQNAQIGPVFLFYPSTARLDQALQALTVALPDIDISADNDVRHEIWIVSEEHRIAEIQDDFRLLDALYVADGHHRSAAAANVCKLRRDRNPRYSGEEPFNFFLAVAFPHNQLKILPYNRVIRDLHGMDAQTFLQRLAGSFEVEPVQDPEMPTREHCFGMYLQGGWYRLCARSGSYDVHSILDQLDVNILQKNILSPLLGIHDPRTDKRVNFVGGIRGQSELERLIDSGQYALAFSLFPTSIESLKSVADAGLIMPPKSTWFEPKLRSGLVLHLL